MTRAAPHCIERAEWVARFTERIRRQLDLRPPELEHVAAAELESWPEEPGRHACDWQEETPEDAADDNLSNWSN
jgi:hypothetical protein